MGQLSDHPDALPRFSPADSSLIQNHLIKVDDSPLFAQSRRLQLFLTFLVEAALKGEVAQLKEFSIAIDVYGRGPDFDPKQDSIVRTEASRLRKRLEEYYASRGGDDPVRFELPRGGYVLRIEVRRPALAPLTPSLAPTRKFPQRIAIAAVAAILLLTSLGFLVSPHPDGATPTAFTVVASYPGYQFQPSLAPDGRQLAFVWNGTDDNYDIYVKGLDEETPRRITTNMAQDLNPSWSPDGRQVAFLRAAADRQEIFVVPVAGGAERRVGEVKPVSAGWVRETSIMRRLPGPAWSPDGKSLAVADRCSEQPQSGDCIYLISVDGLQRERITEGATVGDYGPAFSPDGKEIVFVRTVADAGISDLFTQRLDGGAALRLTHDSRMISSVAWSPERGIFFVSNRSGFNQLWSIRASGGEPASVSGTGRGLPQVSAASHAGRVVFAESYRNVNIWRTNLRNGGERPALIINSSRITHGPQISPDGSRIVFYSDRSGQPEIWVAEADGSAQHRLTSSPAYRPIGSPNWSPDGTRIVYDSSVSGHSQIYLMGADGTNPHRFTNDAWDDMMPSWSRDGRYIYYILLQNGARSLWKQPVEGGQPLKIADDVSADALETADGRRVVYSKTAPGIFEASSAGGDERPIPELAGLRDSRYRFVGDKGIYLVSHLEPPWVVSFFDFSTRRITPVASIEKTPVFSTQSLSVSRDGQWMVHAQVDQVGSSISMIGEPDKVR